MNTKLLMGASAMVMGAAGVAGLFVPQELLTALRLPATGLLPTFVQLHAAALLGFAMVNWMARGSLIGGIYNRPVLVGNVLHFATGAITLIKLAAAGAAPAYVLVATVVYTILAIGFGMLMFRSPK